MKKLITTCLIICFSLVALTGCKTLAGRHKDIQSVVIEQRGNTETKQAIEITDPLQIAQLTKLINNSRREFSIFMPDYVIQIQYADNSSKFISLKGGRLKIDGVPYKTSEELVRIIEAYFANGQ